MMGKCVKMKWINLLIYPLNHLDVDQNLKEQNNKFYSIIFLTFTFSGTKGLFVLSL